MGLRPCTVCRRPYRGQAQHAYPALIAGVERSSRRHSCCPACFDMIESFVQERMRLIGDEALTWEVSETPKCSSCDQPVEEFAVNLFITLYSRTEPRMDFFGQAHPRCANDAAAHLGLMEQVPLQIAS